VPLFRTKIGAASRAGVADAPAGVALDVPLGEIDGAELHAATSRHAIAVATGRLHNASCAAMSPLPTPRSSTLTRHAPVVSQMGDVARG
jgi:hypothetical protein